jgi:CBS domain containing-hemolysin-like protein
MTPRPKVEAIAQDMPLPDLLKQVTESNHSRFPVYDEDLDHIVGVLHVKDLVRQQTRLKGNFDIRLLLRPAPVVPEHYPVKKLLAALKRQRIHMAIVLDEFGGTAGIVTLEDLVEEVVGEVRDEFDLEYEPFVQVAPGVVEVAGSYLIDDLIEVLPLEEAEPLPDVETVGGFIMTKLGRLPQVNDSISYNDQVQFTVLAVEGLAVGRVRVEYPVFEDTDGNRH